MPIVLDASAMLSLAFRGEGLAFGLAVLETICAEGGHVPFLFWYEVRNALVVNERKGRITIGQAEVFLALLQDLPIVIEPLPADAGVLQLARDHQLSVYDAAYLELAERLGMPLATLDQTLAEAARRIKVQVFSIKS
jgi:predicted nucleic acid-binding protein